MSLPIFHTEIKELAMMETRWASQLNPILSNPMNSSYTLKDVQLSVGSNTINHLQGKPLNGYIITGMRGGFSQIYDEPSTMPKLHLILNSSAAVVVNILVY